jgi:hypothetical protein
VAEIRRVLRPGGRALLFFSLLYYWDAGSHPPPCVGYNRPSSHLLMSRDEVKEAVRSSRGITNEIDAILNSLNPGGLPSLSMRLKEVGSAFLHTNSIRGSCCRAPSNRRNLPNSFTVFRATTLPLYR